MIKILRTFFKVAFLATALLGSSVVFAADSFVIKDIRVNGLQRITAGAVFNALSVRVGDHYESEGSEHIIRELFQMGFFSDIDVQESEGALIINVKERPAITTIEIEGNKDR